MKASIDKCGSVRIEFESQCEALLAPDGKKYLPCHGCGAVLAVDMNVVSELCEECDDRRLAGEGPTMNVGYNLLLRRWARGGHDSKPECEECGADLTGKEVYDVHSGWVGDCCVGDRAEDEMERFDEAGQERYALDDDREDFHSDG